MILFRAKPDQRRNGFRLLTLATAAAALAALTAFFPAENASAEEPSVASSVDGLTEATAAASCWEIKQNDPSASDGVYWLWTPDLGAPDQFYCDQTTDGGGWVLAGRGREGWSESNMGSGTPEQVRSIVTGPEAFKPRQLSSRTIDALLGGNPVSSLQDGIRLHRALNQSGTSWQDLSFTLDSPRDTWTWQFYNNQRVATWTVDGVTRNGGRTSDFGSDNGYRRVTTVSGSAQGWMYGFGFGRNVSGSPAASSYIWGTSSSMPNPRPYTQVFLRPMVSQDDFALEIPEGGTPESTLEPGAQSFALPTAWGVSGLGNGPSSIEGSNEVSAFAEVDGMVLVGGNFTHVQTSSNGTDQQSQAYLAAFDIETGEWVSTFRPTFDNQVKALAALPGGRVAVGGYFSEVNGQPRAGLAVVDVHTGELDTAFSGRLINYLSGGAPVVRALDVQDGWLYVGGSFTHSTGGTESREVYTRAGARFDVSDGTPDAAWNPEFNGTVMALDSSSHGDRTYFAGFFSQSKSSQTPRAAAIATTGADALSWNVQFSNSVRAGYQQAVKEVGERVWLGGSEHSLFSYDRNDFSLLSTVVGKRGGDFQAIASDGVTVYGGCHCFDAMYTGANSWPDVGDSWTSADRVYAAGAWDASTAAYKPDFSPELNTRRGAGAWALFVDSTGTLWEGGDFTYSTRAGFQKQWSGGFVRFAAQDTVAPDKPQNFTGLPSDDAVLLSWDSVPGASSYEVINSDRVIASTTQTSLTVPRVSDDPVFAVRAVDDAGNRSASTAPVPITPPVPGPQDATLIPAGSVWSYWFSSDAPAEGWNTEEFDDTEWPTGPAPLGWGQPALGTTLTSDATAKPITSYYRTSITITDATQVEAVQLTTRADDGIIVSVNGTEVLRQNVDVGTSGSNIYANTAVSASDALANPLVTTVSGSLFTTGANTITAEVHSNYRSTRSHSFELTAIAAFGTQPPPENDDSGDSESDDGEPGDGGEDPGDESGTDGPESSALISAGSSWSYYFGEETVPTDWASEHADLSAWPTGHAPFGWGQASISTPLESPSDATTRTSYYRSQFTLAPDAEGDVTFTTRADDGIIVYVNGSEVARVNMDDGPVTARTCSNTAVSASAALANPVVFTIPSSELTIGSNTVAVEVHSNYRSTPSHSFDMEITQQ